MRVLARTLSIKEQAEDKGEVGVEDSERCHSSYHTTLNKQKPTSHDKLLDDPSNKA